MRDAAEDIAAPGPRGGPGGTATSRPSAEYVAEPSAPSTADSSAPHSTPPHTGRATWENAATPRARGAAPRRPDGAGAGADPRPTLAPWWAVRLLGETLLRLPDCTPYLGVLRVLAGWVVERARERGCRRTSGRGSGRRSRCPPRSGPICCGGSWWRTARAATTGSWLPPVSSWWPTPGPRSPCCAPGSSTTGGCRLPAATVATAAQALLYTHREGHADTLVDALVADGHERADELLSTLAEEDPGAVCRGVARWSVDPRPARRVAAVAYGLRAAPYAASGADRELLRVAAATLLSRTADAALHGGALALLVRDPVSRGRYVEQAAARFAAAHDPQLTAAALGVALATHPGPVLDAFRRRLAAPGSQAGDVLRVLAEETAPAVAAPATAFAGSCSGRAPTRRATSRSMPNAVWRGVGPTRRWARWSAPRSVPGRPPSARRWRLSWRRRATPPAPRSVATCWRNCSGRRPTPTSSKRSSSRWSSATTRAPARRRGSGTDTPRGCGARSCAWGRCWPGARRAGGGSTGAWRSWPGRCRDSPRMPWPGTTRTRRCGVPWSAPVG
ncbi:hypothetical protein ACFQVA_32040 [Actinomadura keratinilytica]